MREQHVGSDTAEVEALAARQHRHRYLVHLRRREQELDVRGRLFERFQKRIEGVARQHVHFVDDVYLVARRHRGVRSEEHTSELQSLMRISYAVFCLKKNTKSYV